MSPDNGCQRLDVGEEYKYKGIVQDSFGEIIKLFCILTVVVTQIYKCVKIYRTVHTKKVNFTV